MSDVSRSALLALIRERLPLDPLVGAKVGAEEVKMHLLELITSSRGVQVESLLAVAGTLAGRATQVNVNALAQAQDSRPVAGFQTLQTEDGRLFAVG